MIRNRFETSPVSDLCKLTLCAAVANHKCIPDVVLSIVCREQHVAQKRDIFRIGVKGSHNDIFFFKLTSSVYYKNCYDGDDGFLLV